MRRAAAIAVPPAEACRPVRCRHQASCPLSRASWPGGADRPDRAPRARCLALALPGRFDGKRARPGLRHRTAPCHRRSTRRSFYFLIRRPVARGPRSPAFRRPQRRPRRPFDVDVDPRRDFPILQRAGQRQAAVWLDNAATTQKPQAVIDRLSLLLRARELEHPPRRPRARRPRDRRLRGGAREGARASSNAVAKDEIVFVRGTTEAINLVAQTWGGKNIGARRRDRHHLARAPREHRAVAAALRGEGRAPARRPGRRPRPGHPRANTQALLGPQTKLVPFTQVSNALGTVTPAQQMVEMAHRHGARVLVDGAQSVSHMPVDVQELGCDFFVFSGHKVFGPTGIGVVYGSEDALDAMPPWQGGGNMIPDVTLRADAATRARPRASRPARQHRRRGRARRGARLRRARRHRTHRGLRARAARLRDTAAGRRSPACASSAPRTRRPACCRSCSTATNRGGRRRSTREGIAVRAGPPLRAADPAPLRPRGHGPPVARALQHLRGHRRVHQRGAPHRRGRGRCLDGSGGFPRHRAIHVDVAGLTVV